MKLLIIGILLLSTTTVMAKGHPKFTDDNFKSCLAEVFTKQSLYHNEKSQYAKNIKELGMQKNDICKGMKLKFKKADKETFVVEARAGRMLWSVDDSKTIQKIK